MTISLSKARVEEFVDYLEGTLEEEDVTAVLYSGGLRVSFPADKILTAGVAISHFFTEIDGKEDSDLLVAKLNDTSVELDMSTLEYAVSNVVLLLSGVEEEDEEDDEGYEEDVDEFGNPIDDFEDED